MNYTDYKPLKTGGFQSVGLFGENIYAYEILTGIDCKPEYRQISKLEFESFEQWSREKTTDHGTLFEIMNRTPICSAAFGRRKLNEKLLVKYD